MLADIIHEQCSYADVHLVVVNDKMDSTLLAKVKEDVQVYLIRRKEGSRSLSPIFKLNKILFQNSFDAIHCHDESLARMFLTYRKRTVLTIHHIDPDVKALNLYARLFAISKSVQKDVRERSGMTPMVIYNGILCDRVRQRNFTIFSQDQHFRIVQVGRLEHKIKGQHILLEALNILSQVYGMNKLRVDFIGEGASLNYLIQTARGLGLSERVRFLGLMNRNSIYDQLCEYHALIQPSIHEGFGLTVVEAMAARIPVLVSDVDGPMEIISDGQFGLYFRVGDARDCAERIRALIEEYNTTKTHEMIQRAWIRVNENFDIRVTAKKYYDEYWQPVRSI